MQPLRHVTPRAFTPRPAPPRAHHVCSPSLLYIYIYIILLILATNLARVEQNTAEVSLVAALPIAWFAVLGTREGK